MMDQRITLQASVTTPDGAGGVVAVWQDFATNPIVWAKVTAKAGREGLTEGRMNASFVTLFEIWNRADVNETHRILYLGEAYNIRGVRRQGGRQLRLVIEAERGVAQ